MSGADPRHPHPGNTDDDPYCIDLYCPSFLDCRRASWEPHQDGSATISFMTMPDQLLGGLICSWFQPTSFNPVAPVDGNPKGEKPQALSAKHDSAVPKAGAQ